MNRDLVLATLLWLFCTSLSITVFVFASASIEPSFGEFLKLGIVAVMSFLNFLLAIRLTTVELSDE